MSNIRSIDKRVKKINPSFMAYEKNMCVYLEGETDSFDELVQAGKSSVTLDHLGVVNNIKLTKAKEETISHEFDDYSLHGLSVDVLIIGGGVIGCSILRELSRYKLHTLLIEKESDIGSKTSGKHPGIIHSGVDIDKRTKKYSYYSRGLRNLEKTLNELEVPFKKVEEKIYFKYLYERSIYPFMSNNAYNKKLTNIRFYKDRNKNSINKYKASVRFNNAFVVDSFKYVSQLSENALSNGAIISLNTYCFDMDIENSKIKCVYTNKGKIFPKVVINASGIYADKIAEMAQDRTFTILKEKRNVIVYQNPLENILKGVISKSPFMNFNDITGEVSYSPIKGIYRTIRNNKEFLIKSECLASSIYGDAVFESKVKLSTDYNDHFEYEDVKSLSRIALNIHETLTKDRIKRYFTLIDSNTYENDVVIRKGILTKNIIEAAGIDSSSIVIASPLALDITEWVVDYLKNNGIHVTANKVFQSHHKSIKRLKDYPVSLRDKLIKLNPNYGDIVIKSEEVSLGEIIDVCNMNINITSIDQVKRRLGIDTESKLLLDDPIILDILSKNRHLDIKSIRKNSIGSNIFDDSNGGVEDEL